MPPSVEFHEGPPRKYLVDGVEVPSVTTVLGCLEKPALPWWGMKTGVQGVCELARRGRLTSVLDWADNPDEVVSALTAHKLTVNHKRDRAATRGTNVHDALEAYADLGTIPRLDAFPESEQGYVRGLAKWLYEARPEFLKTEVIVGSARFGYAGRYDLLCRLPDDFGGELVRVDLKTSGRVYESMFLQLAAYEEAAVECGEDPSDAQYVLRVGADGTYEFVRSCATFQDFADVLRCYQALQRVKAASKAARRAEKAVA